MLILQENPVGFFLRNNLDVESFLCIEIKCYGNPRRVTTIPISIVLHPRGKNSYFILLIPRTKRFSRIWMNIIGGRAFSLYAYMSTKICPFIMTVTMGFNFLTITHHICPALTVDIYFIK